MKPRLLIVLGMLLLSLAAVACGPAAAPGGEGSPATEALPATNETADPERTPVPTTLPASTNPPQAAPTEPVLVGPGGQFATDPSTVDLASGRPSLVKFFAFW